MILNTKDVQGFFHNIGSQHQKTFNYASCKSELSLSIIYEENAETRKQTVLFQGTWIFYI